MPCKVSLTFKLEGFDLPVRISWWVDISQHRLGYDMVYFCCYCQWASMPAIFNRSSNEILIVFIFHAGLYHQVSGDKKIFTLLKISDQSHVCLNNFWTINRNGFKLWVLIRTLIWYKQKIKFWLSQVRSPTCDVITGEPFILPFTMCWIHRCSNGKIIGEEWLHPPPELRNRATTFDGPRSQGQN